MSRSNLDLRNALSQIPTEVLVQLERNYHVDILAFLPPRGLCGAEKDSFTCNLPHGHAGDHQESHPSGGCVGWRAG
jgi:hypothetical protein